MFNNFSCGLKKDLDEIFYGEIKLDIADQEKFLDVMRKASVVDKKAKELDALTIAYAKENQNLWMYIGKKYEFNIMDDGYITAMNNKCEISIRRYDR